MSMLGTIEKKLANAITLSHLDVIDESSNHNVPEGSESHFKVILVTDEFNDKSLLQRHRLVNEVLLEELKHKIHALAIHTYTIQEWTEQNNNAPMSPPCLGGGK
ncbi:Cell division protein BolA [hydrothermal vent metagenome]|uniref:Cell division protein BolA n=1 Tax=hydrothermal vent metagenome TaxID=652676 RepID=A0A3B1AHC3_9ZZZZ